MYIDWTNKIINVYKSDMVQIQTVPTEIYELDIPTFKNELKLEEESETGIVYLDTHFHNVTVEVGGVILASVVTIINGYTVTFEDGQYAVNLVGANSNIGDVVNVNQVSVRSANSAGLQEVNYTSPEIMAEAIWNNLSRTLSGTVDANIVSVTDTPVTNVDDFKADVSNLDVDLSTIPASVWSYVSRELTADASLTDAQIAKMDEILTAISNVDGGGGSSGNEWTVTI